VTQATAGVAVCAVTGLTAAVAIAAISVAANRKKGSTLSLLKKITTRVFRNWAGTWFGWSASIGRFYLKLNTMAPWGDGSFWHKADIERRRRRSISVIMRTATRSPRRRARDNRCHTHWIDVEGQERERGIAWISPLMY
jgi:hypothetical protein